MAAGERLNEAVDWPSVIREVRDVGLAQLAACRSLLRQAMLPLLKLHAWPDSPASLHGRREIGTFLLDAEDRFTPSMRQRIDLDELYAKALHLMREDMNANKETRPLPGTCPFTLDELLGPQPDVSLLVARLGSR